VRDLRLDYHEALDTRGPVRYCATQGCGQPTRGAKPHCSDHVLAHPYAARVSGAWDARIAAAHGGELSPELIADARRAVEERGTVTSKRLARVLDLDAATTDRVVRALAREGFSRGRTRRGTDTLTVPGGGVAEARRRGKRRGGRRPGTWRHVTLGEVLRWIDGPGSAIRLAKLMGVTTSTVSGWRSGRWVPSERAQLALAAVVRAGQASGAA
jgi:DNA-binding IscR family transcriptional regulator